MFGLAQGQQSGPDLPALQVFSRLRGNLVDIVSGSFYIDNLSNPTATAPAPVVSVTAINIVADKLGTGRFVIRTGSTAAWTVGSYRVVASFKQSAAGPTLRQVIPFEILTPVDWPYGGIEYVGYVSTFALYRGGFATYPTADIRLLHEIINLAGKDIEKWTGHTFRPQYGHRYLAGEGTNLIILDDPGIAVESLQWIWHTADGEDSWTYTSDQYWFHNHRLDGESGLDTRLLSTLEFLLDASGDPYVVTREAPWMGADKNLKMWGIFGYTDPEADFGASQHAIGETPRPLAEACAKLVAKRYEDRLTQNPASAMLGRIAQMKTRDQSIKFFSGKDSTSMAGIPVFSGDPLIDKDIARYCRLGRAVFV